MFHPADRDGKVEKHKEITKPQAAPDTGRVNHRVAQGLEIFRFGSERDYGGWKLSRGTRTRWYSVFIAARYRHHLLSAASATLPTSRPVAALSSWSNLGRGL